MLDSRTSLPAQHAQRAGSRLLETPQPAGPAERRPRPDGLSFDSVLAGTLSDRRPAARAAPSEDGPRTTEPPVPARRKGRQQAEQAARAEDLQAATAQADPADPPTRDVAPADKDANAARLDEAGSSQDGPARPAADSAAAWPAAEVGAPIDAAAAGDANQALASAIAAALAAAPVPMAAAAKAASDTGQGAGGGAAPVAGQVTGDLAPLQWIARQQAARVNSHAVDMLAAATSAAARPDAPGSAAQGAVGTGDKSAGIAAEVPLKDLVATLVGSAGAVTGKTGVPSSSAQGTAEAVTPDVEVADPAPAAQAVPSAESHSLSSDPVALLDPAGPPAAAMPPAHAAQRASHAQAHAAVAASGEAVSLVPAEDHAGRNVQRLAAMVHATLGQARSVARMQLQPPELGAVTAVVQLHQNKMDLRLEVASEAARDMVSGGLDRLRETLQQQGISLDRASVSIAPRNEHPAGDQQQPAWTGQPDHGSGQFHPGQDRQQGEPGLATSFAVELPAEAAAGQAGPVTATVYAAGLNILA